VQLEGTFSNLFHFPLVQSTEPQRSVRRTNAVYREGAMKISTALAFASSCLAFAPIVATAGAPENQQSCKTAKALDGAAIASGQRR
jgi:hypothetical protein